jgi:hypothetical protein
MHHLTAQLQYSKPGGNRTALRELMLPCCLVVLEQEISCQGTVPLLDAVLQACTMC